MRRGADPTEPLSTARTELGRAFDLFERVREFLLEEPQPPETLDFDALARYVAANHPGVRVEGETGGAVLADRGALAAGLAALVVNAVEASGPSSVVIRLARDGACVRASVENPGRLEVSNPEALFSPKSAGPGKGWGMGLSRARVAAADAGGSVRIEQRDGRVTAILEIPEETR